MENVLVTVEGIVEDVSIHVDSTTEVVHVNVETATASLVVIRRSAAEGAPVDGTTEATYLGQPCIVGDANGPFTVYTATQVSPSRWTAGTATSESIAAAIHAADAATPASADEWGFWKSVGGVLKKITHANFVTMVKAFLGTAAQATLGTGAGQVPVRGDYDPAGSAATVQAVAVTKTRMLIGNAFDDDEVPQASGYAYYAGSVNGKPCFRGTSLAATWETTAGGRWELRSGANSIWSSPEPVATPDLVTTWTPLVSASTTQPTVVASGSLIDVQQYSETLNSAQPAAIPSIRALGTGALDAMPGDAAVLRATGATAGATSQAQAFTNGVLLRSATNQIVTGTTTNLSTIIFPLSSGAVTVTMPNTTCTVARSASALTTGRVVLTTTNGVLTDSANLTWNGTILAITGGMTVSATLAVTGAFTVTGLLTANGGIQSGTGAGEIDVASASGALLGVRTVEATSAAMSGATVTVGTNIIPAGSYVLGVTVRVMTLVACGSSTFQVGDGTDADAWGSAIAVAAGTASASANFNITAPAFYAAATNVVLTANGTAFTAGVVKVAVHYITLTGPTA